MRKKKENKHKHDWQLLTLGSVPTYIGTEMKGFCLIICRECTKILKKDL